MAIIKFQIETMDVAPGVVVKEGDRTKKGPKQVNSTCIL